MVIHRAVLIVAVIASMTVSLHAQNLVRNSGFVEAAPRTGAGDIPPNRVTYWASAYQTPQLVPGPGCRDANAIAMWGNRAAGEAIVQNVTLRKGTVYDVELCARYRDSKIPYSHVELRASTALLRDPACPSATCEAMEGAKKVTSATWTRYRFQFTPTRDSTYLTVSASNDIDINDGAQVSWVEVDNISITPRPLVPLLNARTPTAVPDQYLLIFKAAATRNDMAAAEDAVKRLNGTVLFRYETAIKGLGIKLPAGTSVQPLRALAGLEYIAVDQKVTAFTIQTPAPDGLDRIDRRLLSAPAMDDWFTYSETGTNVHAYVIDTGIRASHTDFGGRATSIDVGNGAIDCNGHGTHVAGTIGGAKYGVAKNVKLYGVRVLDCGGGGTEMTVLAGVNWVAANRTMPAVVNMSLGAPVPMPALETAVTNSIAAGITYVVAAGNANVDACNTSPARVPNAITVGASIPASDARATFSNWGTCLDLFAPGVGIESAWNTSDAATNNLQGTSMAAPHVAGAVALFLEENPAGTPAAALARLHYNDNVFGVTPNWPGVGNRGTGSPNELLHWGSLSDGYSDGDPHLTTVDGAHFDFQSAGEFVLLRGNRGMEIQTRQTPISTTWGTCVSVNTAVAARVGTHRVTYQPNGSELQLRVDGVVTTLGPQGLSLSGGGRIAPAPTGGGIEIDFPNDGKLIITPGWWDSLKLWFFNLHVARTRAQDGILGVIPQGSWIPALPTGKSMGPKPATAQQRYVDLYRIFADAWRVTPASSLFDYAPGTSTDTFTNREWPPENGPCTLPNQTPVKPAEPAVAQKACAGIFGFDLRSDCIFDVTATGETGFAKTYLVTQQLRGGATQVTITDAVDPTYVEPATFTATVAPLTARGGCRPSGTVQFFIDGNRFGEPVRIDGSGRAQSRPATLGAGVHQIAASFAPDEGSSYLPSRSVDEPHTVRGLIDIQQPAVN